MTIEDAIKHEEVVAKELDKLCKRYDDASGYTRSHNEDIRTTGAKKCAECAKEHRQLAEWLKELEQLREQTKWIPIKTRPLTDKEKEKYAYLGYSDEELGFMYDCLLPEDGEEVLITTRYDEVKTDTFYCDEGGYFESYCDEDDVKAWMPLPKPYKADR